MGRQGHFRTGGRQRSRYRALGLGPLPVLITVSDRLVHLMLHGPMVYAEPWLVRDDRSAVVRDGRVGGQAGAEDLDAAEGISWGRSAPADQVTGLSFVGEPLSEPVAALAAFHVGRELCCALARPGTLVPGGDAGVPVQVDQLGD
jgi:hypothetical protein